MCRNSSGNYLRLVSTANDTDEVRNLDVSWVVDAARVAEA
jgi:hypothetical protein